MIRPKFALVADPDLSFPAGSRDSSDAEVTPAGQPAIARALAGLAEEDRSDLSDADLDRFLNEVVRLGGRYRKMLERLAAQGTQVFRWGEDPVAQLRPIYEALAPSGFDIVGPSQPHLRLCRDQIVAKARDARGVLAELVERAAPTVDAELSAAELLRAATATRPNDEPLIDRKGQGSALNCQSIVIVYGPHGNRVLLAGDMQFAVNEVDGLDREMADLRSKVVAAGPYRLVKTMHHTSYNGLGEDLWNDLGKPTLLVHSGGLWDDQHPDRKTLAMLSALSGVRFARTDHNGRVTFDSREPDERALRVQRGQLDDYEPNVVPVRKRVDLQAAWAPAPPTAPSNPLTPSSAATTVEAPAALQTAPEPILSQRSTERFVDIVFVRVPYENGRIVIDDHVIQIDRSPGRAKTDEGPTTRRAPAPKSTALDRMQIAGSRLGNGRDLSGLVFLTNKSRLAWKIGDEGAGIVERLVGDGGAALLEIGENTGATGVLRNSGPGTPEGVVLIGGYDVVPSQRVDVLDPALRAAIPSAAIAKDRDEFVVWSDDTWGDIKGDGMAELPVSRIPDGGSQDLVIRALTASDGKSNCRFGIRNVLRPFASAIYDKLPGNEPLLLSAPTRYDQIPSLQGKRSYTYLMLHGLDRDGTRFWGDDPARGGIVEAINVGAVPEEGWAVVFAGCCWGALIVNERANQTTGAVTARTPAASMALTTLAAGALAFVGSTGVHYSPGPEGGFFGGPMHDAFWHELLENRHPPAKALYEARQRFLTDMPHRRKTPLELGIERKVYKQFTCLGLGW